MPNFTDRELRYIVKNGVRFHPVSEHVATEQRVALAREVLELRTLLRRTWNDLGVMDPDREGPAVSLFDIAKRIEAEIGRPRYRALGGKRKYGK